MRWLRRWFAAFCHQQRTRQQATRHMAIVARAVWTGSTNHYNLDVNRRDGSTEVWW